VWSTRHVHIATALLLLAALALSGAKCIEHDSLRRGADGDWHIYGEIHNKTDLPGAGIAVQGTLVDATGNVIATAQAATCPTSLSPGTFSVYDVRFHDTAGLPQPASHRINVAAGEVSATLPPLNATFEKMSAKPGLVGRIEAGAILALADGPPPASAFPYCVAFYDDDGDVVDVRTATGELIAGTNDVRMFQISAGVPATAVSVRFIAWRESVAGMSTAAMSRNVRIAGR
jgi:hypothetical protein